MEKFVRKGHEGVKFFIGPEIEQTPAFGKKTLFVVGLQDTKKVESLAREHRISHIFLSANRSFDSIELRNGVYMVDDTLASDWEKQIHYLLDCGFMVSIDYPAHKHVDVLQVLNQGIWQSRNFVPVLSVAIPKVNTSSVNLTVKIDDSNFKATNPGVWCMNHSEVTDSNRFTSWDEYGDDMILDDSELPQQGKKISITVTDNISIAPSESVVIKTLAEGDATVKNLVDAGLDPVSPSMLKTEITGTATDVVEQIKTVDDAAAAYAEGATVDPLGQDAPKKSKVTKAPKA